MKTLMRIMVAGITMTANVSMVMAAPTILDSEPFIARAKTTGTEKVEMTSVIKKWDKVHEPDSETEILWSDVDIDTMGLTNWKIADHLIVLDTTITSFNGAIQILTDNQHPTQANPFFVDPTPLPATNPPAVGTPDYIGYVNNPDSNPAGLVLNIAGSSKYTLPVAWTVKTSTKALHSAVELTGLMATDPNTGNASGSGNRFQWLFISDRNSPAIDWNLNRQLGDTESSLNIDLNGDGDKSDLIDTPAFVDGNENSIVIDAGLGLHVGQGSTFNGAGAGKRTSYIYFQANFENAFANAPYKTSRLLLEAFTE